MAFGDKLLPLLVQLSGFLLHQEVVRSKDHERVLYTRVVQMTSGLDRLGLQGLNQRQDQPFFKQLSIKAELHINVFDLAAYHVKLEGFGGDIQIVVKTCCLAATEEVLF